MSDPTHPFPELSDPPVDPPIDPGVQEPTAATDPAAAEDESELLDQLEADLAAVETAIGAIERITSDSVGGEQAAAEIRAAVSVDRFGVTDAAPVVDRPGA